MCRNFSWTLLGETFITDIMLVTLGSYEMVLGIQWLASLGPILWDFEKLRMEFKQGGRRVVLRGTQKTDLEWMGGKRFRKPFISQYNSFHVHITWSSTLKIGVMFICIADLEIQKLLEEFAIIFEEPKALPPHKEYDNKIHLKHGTTPINVRPYRYPTLQKDVIEKTVQEMLQAGVIRVSHSAYSSLIALVKKKDGSWRLCVDYMQLNKHAILTSFQYLPLKSY